MLHRTSIRAYPGNVYLMYITRETHYPELVRQCDRLQKPVYEATVNGAPVRNIHNI